MFQTTLLELSSSLPIGLDVSSRHNNMTSEQLTADPMPAPGSTVSRVRLGALLGDPDPRPRPNNPTTFAQSFPLALTNVARHLE